MRTPEDDAMRATMYDWQEALINQEKPTQAFLKDALTAIFEGMLSLDSKISSLSGQEWKSVKQVIDLQDEMNMQRYKMIMLQDAITENKND